MQYILQEMHLATDHDGCPMFEPEMINKVEKRAVDGCLERVFLWGYGVALQSTKYLRSSIKIIDDGAYLCTSLLAKNHIKHRFPDRDYNNELSEVLLLKDSSFQPHLLQFWTENMIVKNVPAEEGFVSVDAEITKLDKNAREASFRQDCLKLTRDCAQLAVLYKTEAKHQRAERLHKVSHLKEQNTLGANYIRQFMSRNTRFLAGRLAEQETAMDEADSCQLTLDVYRKSIAYFRIVQKPFRNKLIIVFNKLYLVLFIDKTTLAPSVHHGAAEAGQVWGEWGDHRVAGLHEVWSSIERGHEWHPGPRADHLFTNATESLWICGMPLFDEWESTMWTSWGDQDRDDKDVWSEALL